MPTREISSATIPLQYSGQLLFSYFISLGKNEPTISVSFNDEEDAEFSTPQDILPHARALVAWLEQIVGESAI